MDNSTNELLDIYLPIIGDDITDIKHEVSPLKKLLESQRSISKNIDEDIQLLNETNESLLHEVKTNNAKIHRENVEARSTINSTNIINTSRELMNIEQQFDENGLLISTLQEMNDKLGKHNDNSNVTDLLKLIHSKLNSSIPVSKPQSETPKEKLVEGIKSPDSRLFKGLKELLSKSGVKEKGFLGTLFEERKLYKSLQKDYGGELAHKYTLRGITSATTKRAIEKLGTKFSPLGTALEERKIQKEYVLNSLKNNKELREKFKKSTKEEQKQIKKDLVVEAKQLRKLAKEQVTLESQYNKLKESGISESASVMVRLNEDLTELKKEINEVDKSKDNKNKPPVEGELVPPDNAPPILQPQTNEHKIVEVIERLSSVLVERNAASNIEDKVNISEEEQIQINFQNKLLEIEEKQLTVQNKIYDLLKEYKDKGIGLGGAGALNTGVGGLVDELLPVVAGAGGAVGAGKLLSRFKNPITRLKQSTSKLLKPVSNLGAKIGSAVREALPAERLVAEESRAISPISKVIEKGKGAIKSAVKSVASTAEKVAPKATQAVKSGVQSAKQVASKIMTPTTTKIVETGAKSASGKIATSISKLMPKQIGKLLPLAGAGFGIMGAYEDIKEGDWLGAGLNAIATVGSLAEVTGVATAPGVAITTGAVIASVARDVYKDVYGIDPEDDPEIDKRMPEIKAAVISKVDQLKKEVEEKGVVEGTKAAFSNDSEKLVDEELSKQTETATVNNEPVKAEQVKVVDYNEQLKNIETERTTSAKQLSESYSTDEDIQTFYTNIDSLKQQKAEVIAKRDNKPVADVIAQLDNTADVTSRNFYNLKPVAAQNNNADVLYTTSKEVDELKSKDNESTSEGNTVIAPTNITNNNQTTIVKKEPRNNENTLNQLNKNRSIFNS